MPEESPQKKYLLTGSYKRMSVEGIDVKLNPLELAIVGYVSQSPVRETDGVRLSPNSQGYQLPDIAPSATNRQLEVLVFEYLKIRASEGDDSAERCIRAIIEKNRRIVRELKRGYELMADRVPESKSNLSPLISRAGALHEALSRLSEKPIREMEYGEFNPVEDLHRIHGSRYMSGKYFPFARYALRQIKRLKELNILLSYFNDGVRRQYLTLRPGLEISIREA
ncbi:hypothetical protein HYY70_00695 [Candidatus Woesearchaeota archaeon]|nr:hypothetical protein [Candidatus Woesearchaeota archaeon]